jgi:hypothetical protein
MGGGAALGGAEAAGMAASGIGAGEAAGALPGMAQAGATPIAQQSAAPIVEMSTSSGPLDIAGLGGKPMGGLLGNNGMQMAQMGMKMMGGQGQQQGRMPAFAPPQARMGGNPQPFTAQQIKPIYMARGLSRR